MSHLDHQHPRTLPGLATDSFSGLQTDAERFFNQCMLAGLQCSQGHLFMQHMGETDAYRPDRRIFEKSPIIFEGLYFSPLSLLGIDFRNARQMEAIEPCQCAGMLTAGIAIADDSQVDRHSYLLTFLKR
jgi:hypothetical protein